MPLAALEGAALAAVCQDESAEVTEAVERHTSQTWPANSATSSRTRRGRAAEGPNAGVSRCVALGHGRDIAQTAAGQAIEE